MKGLLKKDFCLLSKYMRFILIYAAAMSVLFAVTSQNAVNAVASAVSLLSFLLPIYAITTISLDENGKWDTLAVSFPLSRAQIVGSKYLLALIMLGLGIVGGAVCVGAISLFGDEGHIWFENVGLLLGLLCYNAVILSILLPLVFKFGSEKSRFIMAGVYMVPTFLLVFLFNRFKEQLNVEEMLRAVKEDTGLCCLLLGGAILLAAGTMFLSYLVSLGIYRKKEF